MEISALLIAGLLVALFAVFTVVRAVRIVPQARARNVERLGRYHRTLQPGLNFVIPYIDRVYPVIDLREQVVSFQPQPVITEDNLVVEIDTVLYFQVTDPRAAAYEIASYLQAVEQLTVTTLRNVVGSMDLEQHPHLPRHHQQPAARRAGRGHRQVGAAGQPGGDQGHRPAARPSRTRWRSRCAPSGTSAPRSSAPRGSASPRSSPPRATSRAPILRAEGNRTAAILKAEGQSRAIDEVFQAVHRNDPDPKLLAYQYLQMLPQLAQGAGNTFWVIPSEVTSALQGVSRAFTEVLPAVPAGAEPLTTPAAADTARAAAAAAAAMADAAEPDPVRTGAEPVVRRSGPAGNGAAHPAPEPKAGH